MIKSVKFLSFAELICVLKRKESGMDEASFQKRFETYFILFRSNPVDGILRHRIKFVLMMLNLKIDDERFCATLMQGHAGWFVSLEQARHIVSMYRWYVGNQVSDDERILAVIAQQPHHLDPEADIFTVQARFGQVKLDWCEYQIYQIALHDENILHQQLGVAFD